MEDSSRHPLPDPLQLGPPHLTPHLLFPPRLEVFPSCHLGTFSMPRDILLDLARVPQMAARSRQKGRGRHHAKESR